jgi:hypothetical protein
MVVRAKAGAQVVCAGETLADQLADQAAGAVLIVSLYACTTDDPVYLQQDHIRYDQTGQWPRAHIRHSVRQGDAVYISCNTLFSEFAEKVPPGNQCRSRSSSMEELQGA